RYSFAAAVLVCTVQALAGRETSVSVRFTSPPPDPLPERVTAIKVLKPNYVDRAGESGILNDPKQRYYQLFVGQMQRAIGSSGRGIVIEHEDQVAGHNEDKARRILGDEDREAPAPAEEKRNADATITVRFWFDTRMEPYVVKRAPHKVMIERITTQIPGI